MVYVKDVAAAALFLFREPGPERIEAYIVSSDEEPGNTNREVQAYLDSERMPPARPLAVAAPIIVPHLMRALWGREANGGDVIFTSNRKREAGFLFPYGLWGGLDDAVSGASPASVRDPGDRWLEQLEGT